MAPIMGQKWGIRRGMATVRPRPPRRAPAVRRCGASPASEPAVVVADQDELDESRVASISASMWPRYDSRAARPSAVSRYAVRGVRPANDLVHERYPASSSFRACTLRFPSLVFSAALRSLKVRVSATASALMIERRVL